MLHFGILVALKKVRESSVKICGTFHSNQKSKAEVRAYRGKWKMIKTLQQYFGFISF